MEYAQIIRDTLRQLGVGGNYIAQQRTVAAIQMAVDDENRLLHVTKSIYYPAAEICGCKWSTVERNIRMVIQRVWRINPQGLIRMAGYPLNEPPTASDFIEILAHYIRCNLIAPGQD
jgi:hypothetical protein